MDVYRAKRNVALAEGIWRQGTDRIIDPSKYVDEIASGKIVRVGADVVEEARPALHPDEPLPPDVDPDVDFSDPPTDDDSDDDKDGPVGPGPFASTADDDSQ